MDALVFSALVRELAPLLEGARINKIHQPSGDELLLRLWNGEHEQRLYLRARAGSATLYLTGRRFANPFTPPRFCQLLRARLSRMERLEQWHAERLAVLSFSGRKGECYRLLIDFRRAPNLVLLGDGVRVVDALHRDPVAGAMPGGSFVFPEPRPINLLKELPAVIPSASAEQFRQWLSKEVGPVPPWLATACERRVEAGDSPRVLLGELRERLLRDTFDPVQLEISGRSRLLPFRLSWVDAISGESYATVSEGIEAFDADSVQATRHDPLLSRIDKAIERLERRRVYIERDRCQLKELERLKHQADLLLANRHLLRRGQASIEVVDYLQDPAATVSIPLDARHTPQQNIDQKFKQIKKLRRGEEHVNRRARETVEEQGWLKEMRLAVEECSDELERDQLSRELAGAGYLKRRQEPPGRSRPKVPDPLLRTCSPGGYELVWGKNPRGNEKVSHQLASGEDLWFHAHERPGCHLLLRRAGRREEVPDQDIAHAASLAAGYSAARNDPLVEVMVASAADVRKPKGARPGLVTVSRFRTVRVAPLRLPQDLDNG